MDHAAGVAPSAAVRGELTGTLVVRPIQEAERRQWEADLDHYHYLGACRLIAESLSYVALVGDQRVGWVSWAVAALHNPPRDHYLGWPASVCPACVEQEAGSSFLTNLAAGGITVSGVNYTVISTIYDEVVIPWQSQQLSGSNVTNVVIQDQCAIDYSGHLGIAFDHIALRDVLNALDPAHPKTPVCTYIAFEHGG
jgi:hypothetical protein